MRIIRCDRCKKDFPKGVSKVGFAEIKTIDAWTGEIKEEDPECKEWDLCPECTENIRLFIKNVGYVEMIKAAAAEAGDPVKKPEPVQTEEEKYKARIDRLRKIEESMKEQKEENESIPDKRMGSVKAKAPKKDTKGKLDRDKVWALWQEGWSYKAIAKELGVSETEVKACL